MDNLTICLIAGIVIMTISMLRYNIKRRRQDLKKEAERHATLRAAREAEAKRQRELGQDVKKIEARSSLGNRMPLPNPVGTTFTGSATPQNIARWETEIHEIGRQVTGKIDSKMIALQTLTAEANRAANRLELLLEQIERILQHMKNIQAEPASSEPPVEPEAEPTPKPFTEPETNAMNPAVLRGVEKEAETFADILNELETEIEELESMEDMPMTQNASSVTILKAETATEYQKMAGEAKQTTELSRSSGDVLSLRSSGERKPTPRLSRDALSLDSLYDNGLAEREGEKVFAVAGVGSTATVQETAPSPVNSPVVKELGRTTHLDLRKQVEMLADYGHTSREIAQTMNITVGEVDLMLSLRD